MNPKPESNGVNRVNERKEIIGSIEIPTAEEMTKATKEKLPFFFLDTTFEILFPKQIYQNKKIVFL